MLKRDLNNYKRFRTFLKTLTSVSLSVRSTERHLWENIQDSNIRACQPSYRSDERTERVATRRPFYITKKALESITNLKLSHAFYFHWIDAKWFFWVALETCVNLWSMNIQITFHSEFEQNCIQSPQFCTIELFWFIGNIGAFPNTFSIMFLIAGIRLAPPTILTAWISPWFRFDFTRHFAWFSRFDQTKAGRFSPFQIVA